MPVINQINSLIQNLQSLKPLLSSDSSSNQAKFNEILKSSLNEADSLSDEGTLQNHILSKFTDPKDQKESLVIDGSSSKLAESLVSSDSDTLSVPYWVNPDYPYDVDNPRNPNLRELMEAISGRKLQDLYADKNSNWEDLSTTASELLYGVIGSSISDTRDWTTIMNAEDIITAARSETNKLIQPVIDIATEFDENNNIKDQYAVLKSSSGDTLKALNGNSDSVQKTLDNYDVKIENVASDFEDKIVIENFDKAIIAVIRNLPKSPASPTNSSIISGAESTLENLALNSQLTNISSNLNQTIPLEELDKL